MKVAFLLRKFPVLSETFILDQIAELIDQGCKVDVYALFKGEVTDAHSLIESYQLLERVQFPKVSCSSKSWMRLLQAPKVFWAAQSAPFSKQLQSLNFIKYKRQAFLLHLLYFSSIFRGDAVYDVIHCHFGMYGLVGVDLRDLGLVQGKIITSFHGMDVHIYPKKYGESVYRRLFSQGDLFTANSEFTKNKLVQMGCPPQKLVKLPVGLRTELYDTEKFKSKNDKTQLLTVARLTEKKGLEYSIRAVAKTYSQCPNIDYSIVGEGALRDPLHQLIHDLNATNYIHLLGSRNQEELRSIYASSDIFVLASVTAANGDMEGQGLVLQEAQASGLPVVSTWHNGIPEGILMNQSGFLVPERDVDALTERLVYLIKNPNQRQKMGQVGQRFVRKYFDVNALSHQLLKLYGNLL